MEALRGEETIQTQTLDVYTGGPVFWAEWYRDELLKIHSGAPIRKLLSNGEKCLLKRQGLLFKARVHYRLGNHYILTPIAKRVLNIE